MIRSSVVYFAERLPAPYHVHHGALDPTVPVAQGRRLRDRMAALGVGAPDYAYFEYEEGRHTVMSLPGSVESVTALLCAVLD